VLAIGVPLLLLSAYVSSYWGAQWGEAKGFGWPKNYVNPRHPLFGPLNAYCESDLPGSLPFYTLTLWFVNEGNCSLKQLHPFAEELQRTREKRAAVKLRIQRTYGLPRTASPNTTSSTSASEIADQ